MTTSRAKTEDGQVATLPGGDLIHRHGCPENEARQETYPADTPSGEKVNVTRCGDCGRARVWLGDEVLVREADIG